MQRLADIELQLVMHGLTCAELLRFARCSRWLLHAADSAFAWQHVPQPLLLRHQLVAPSWLRRVWRALTAPDTAPAAGHHGPPSLTSLSPALRQPAASSAPASPLRQARTGLRLECSADSQQPISGSTGGTDGALDGLFALLESLGFGPGQPRNALSLQLQLDELDASQCGLLSGEQRRRLLGHPAVRLISVLKLGYPDAAGAPAPGAHASPCVDALTMRSVLGLQRLHTLDVGSTACCSAAFELLPWLPGLTKLSVWDSCGPDAEEPLGSCLPSVATCPALTWLHVSAPQLSLRGPQLCSFFGAPLMQANLQHLSLERWTLSDGDAGLPAECVAALAGMRALHTLVLGEVLGINLLLAGLVHAPVLRRLVCHGIQEHSSLHCMPRLSVLQTLLDAAPELRCTVRIQAAHSASSWTRFRELAAEQPRLTIEFEDTH